MACLVVLAWFITAQTQSRLQTLQGDETICEGMLPAGFPLEKVLKQAHLHWAPTMYRGASLYRRGDSQLPQRLQENPQHAPPLTHAV